MADRTNDFLKHIRTVASSDALTHAILTDEGIETKRKKEPQRRSSVKAWKHRFDGMPQEALDICRSIQQLHSMLLKNRIAYLTRPIGIQNSGYDDENENFAMSEKQRDEIDAEASTFIVNTLHRIRLFQAKLETIMKQHFEKEKFQELKLHWESIVWYLEKKLTDLSKLQKDMQEKRLQQQEAQKKLRLTQEEAEKLRSVVVETNVPVSPRKASDDNDMMFQLSAQERQVLEKENEQLLDEFSGLEQQVGQAEKSLLEISQLQSTLETHVLTQYEEINRLHDEAAKITDQVVSGNAKLDSAAKHGADSRNIMVFFFLLLSFVMLFLHWYE